jgi:hypothetical protein
MNHKIGRLGLPKMRDEIARFGGRKYRFPAKSITCSTGKISQSQPVGRF